MRCITLFLLLVMAPIFTLANAQEDFTQYFLVKTWRLTGTWTYSKHFRTVEVDGDITKTRTYDAEIWAQAQFRMVQTKAHSSKRYRWQLEKGFIPISRASVHIVDHTLIKPKNGKESWFQMEVSLEGKALEGDGRLDIEPGDGTCRVVAGFMSTSGTVKSTNSQGGSQTAESPFSFSSGMGDCEGQASGMTFAGFRIDGISSVPRERPDLDPVNFKWQVSPWEQDPEGEATFDLVDHDWLPEPDASSSVEIKWKGKAEQVKVTLSGISREPGTCLNSQETDEDEDLLVTSQGKWLVQKEGSREDLKYVALQILPKQDPPQSVKLEIKTKDYGAFGKLQCEVLLDGKWRTTKASGAESLNVPYDANDNRIADVWERKEGVTGYPETWDEAEVEGQTAKGDGLSLYSKYRGVRTADKDWTRLTAKEKVHFVLDPGGAFDTERWLKSTGIRAYKLTDDMVRGGKVDFNAKTAAGAGKYAVRLELRSGTTEEAADADGNVTTKDEPRQYAYSIGNTPRSTAACRIFPDRIRAMIVRVSTLMRIAVTAPVTQAEKEEAALLQSLGIPMEEIKRRLAALDKGQLDTLAQQMIALCAIHEMGHACGVPGHLNGKGEEDQDVQRNPECPSQYLNPIGRRKFILFGQLGGDGSFCKDAPDNCWSHLNVKD
jgi:hypothetical protein